jgi:hypothetical protein
MCQITIQKQKEIAEAEAWQNQPKQVLHTASCHSPYIPEYVGNQPVASVASASHSKLPGLSFHRHHHCSLFIPEASSQKGANTPNNNVTSGRSPKLVQSIALYHSQSTYTKQYPAPEILLFSMPFCFLYKEQAMKS